LEGVLGKARNMLEEEATIVNRFIFEKLESCSIRE